MSPPQNAVRRHYRTAPPPSLSRDLLLRAIAYRLQEQAHGGLSQTTKRALQALARSAGSEGGQAPAPVAALKPGVRLVREWGGETHTVLVLPDGFEYQGGRYRSLTQIAKHITGAHWSGPRFFSLVAAFSRPKLHGAAATPTTAATSPAATVLMTAVAPVAPTAEAAHAQT